MVSLICQFYPVCNFKNFVKFGLGIVSRERVNVTVDLKRPDFAKMFSFAPDIAKTSISSLMEKNLPHHNM